VACSASYLWKSSNFMHLCYLCFMCLIQLLCVQEKTSKDQKSTKVQNLTHFKQVYRLKRKLSRGTSLKAYFKPESEFKPTRFKRVLSRANSLLARFKRVKPDLEDKGHVELIHLKFIEKYFWI